MKPVARWERYELWLDAAERSVARWLEDEAAQDPEGGVELKDLNMAVGVLRRIIDIRRVLEARKSDETNQRRPGPPTLTEEELLALV